MRGLLDFLSRWVEPYVSYRWLLAVIFGAMFVSDLLGTWFWLREIGRPQAVDSPREQQLRRIARAAIGSMLLRLFSWDSLLRQRGVFTSIVLLTALAIALNAYVFAAQ
jgi:hypothetical protein